MCIGLLLLKPQPVVLLLYGYVSKLHMNNEHLNIGEGRKLKFFC